MSCLVFLFYCPILPTGDLYSSQRAVIMEKALYISDTFVKNSSGFSGKHTALQAGLLTTEVTRMRQRIFKKDVSQGGAGVIQEQRCVGKAVFR